MLQNVNHDFNFSNNCIEKLFIKYIHIIKREKMADYIINQGDNLWNIAKSQYQDKLTSNTDIQNAVDKIAEANGIDDPNKIYAGNNLQIPDYESLFAKEDNSKKEPANDEGVFQEFDKWQKMHAINMKKFAEGQYDEYAYNGLTEKIGETFDFMEGKDASDDKDYDEQTLKLGQGEVAQKDSNEDGLVDFKEYFSQELAGDALGGVKDHVKSGLFTEDEAVEMLTGVYLEAQAVFNVIDEAMGNDDGYLDETEFQTYYKYLDTYTDAKDKDRGTIHLDDVAGYPEYLASQFDFSDIDTEPIEKMMRNLLAE